MSGDSDLMRSAASDIATQQKSYNAAIEKIDSLITNKLAQVWVDEAYDDLKTKYQAKQGSLKELGEVIGEFSQNLSDAADDLDSTISGLL